MRRVVCCLLFILLCSSCMGPTITGPSNLYNPPQPGWTKADVQAHWGIPYSSRWYDAGGHSYDTWVYRRSYFVTGAYGNTIHAEFAAVEFRDGRVVGVSY